MNGVNGGKLGCVATKPNLCISNAEARFKKNPGICFIIRKLILIFAMLRGLSPQRDILKKRLLDASILTTWNFATSQKVFVRIGATVDATWICTSRLHIAWASALFHFQQRQAMRRPQVVEMDNGQGTTLFLCKNNRLINTIYNNQLLIQIQNLC